jgi:hypothetical protein
MLRVSWNGWSIGWVLQKRTASVAMKRLHQDTLIVSTILASWFGMQAIHESGHVIAARLTGGRVARVVLHPLAISRTDLAKNPRPLVVAWSGPVAGVLFPVLLWGSATGLRVRGSFVLRFFAGFCLIANGAYVGVGSFDRVGDAGEMIRLGSPIWHLWAFGLATIPTGLWLWHRQGRRFGLGEAGNEVSPSVACATLIMTILLALSGLLFFRD